MMGIVYILVLFCFDVWAEYGIVWGNASCNKNEYEDCLEFFVAGDSLEEGIWEKGDILRLFNSNDVYLERHCIELLEWLCETILRWGWIYSVQVWAAQFVGYMIVFRIFNRLKKNGSSEC